MPRDHPALKRSHGCDTICKGHIASRRRWTVPVVVTALFLTLWLLLSTCRPGRDPRIQISHQHPQSPAGLSFHSQAGHDFRWSEITPSKTLQYTPCFGRYQCARLSVPLNWNTTADERENGPRAAIAVIKLPARVPVTDPRYGGPVVLNPGGPGESGIYQVLSDGQNFQAIVDSPVPPSHARGGEADGGRYFDILSFDPRGVNNTTPTLHCFPDAFNQQAWLLRFPDIGLLWDSDSLVGLEWARAAALGASCSSGLGEGDILPYLNTAQVVEDMVEIVEREGEWRAKEAEKLLAMAKGESTELKRAIWQDVTQRTAYHPGKESLQYWGMSYGTTLGSTFAAMHPDKVGRIVLDGNMDPAEHYAGGFERSLQDSDKIITSYAEYCFQAGPDKCPLHNATSPEAIEARLTSILSSYKTNPAAAALPGNFGPEVVTYGDIQLLLLTSMYFSFAFTERFWSLLPALEVADGTHPEIIAIASRKQAGLSPATHRGQGLECDGRTGGGDPDSCIPFHSWAGAFKVVSCMDAGGGPSSLTRETYDAHRAVLQAQSRWVSPTWSRNMLSCEGLAARPAWRPDLSFERQEWDNTSFPLLIIGNKHDTVTPLANAQRVSRELFPGSVVLQQDSEGHCSHSNPTLCTAKAVREYFQTGKLPEPGTVCRPEMRPFLGCVREDGCWFDSDEARLWEALVELADPFGLSKADQEDVSYVKLWALKHRITGI